jgi:hypothetical protein
MSCWAIQKRTGCPNALNLAAGFEHMSVLNVSIVYCLFDVWQYNKMNSRCQSLSFVQQIWFEDSKAKRNETRSTHQLQWEFGLLFADFETHPCFQLALSAARFRPNRILC